MVTLVKLSELHKPPTNQVLNRMMRNVICCNDFFLYNDEDNRIWTAKISSGNRITETCTDSPGQELSQTVDILVQRLS